MKQKTSTSLLSFNKISLSKNIPPIQQITDHLKKIFAPKAILLHGSRLQMTHYPRSDYDIHLITEHPEKIFPHSYQGYSLDLGGITPACKVLKIGDTPLWPLKLLFEDEDRVGEQLMERTFAVYQKGPEPLSSQEILNRQQHLFRLYTRIEGRGYDFMLRSYYIGEFYQLAIRFYFELNQKWHLSAYKILPLIKREAPVLYQALQGLFSPYYLIHCQNVYHLLLALSTNNSLKGGLPKEPFMRNL